MEKRLIDANAIDTRPRGNNSQRAMWNNIKRIIDAAPTIDPVKHGKWIYDHWCEFKCSECGEFSKTEPRGEENYCPNCGARMEMEDEA